MSVLSDAQMIVTFPDRSDATPSPSGGTKGSNTVPKSVHMIILYKAHITYQTTDKANLAQLRFNAS